MDRKEAAAKWAEANEALEAAEKALDAAQEEHAAAQKCEFDAWGILQQLAGRAPEDEAVPVAEEVLLDMVPVSPGSASSYMVPAPKVRLG